VIAKTSTETGEADLTASQEDEPAVTGIPHGH
jgi:hypothetical protein